jgi:hypothetical protein
MLSVAGVLAGCSSTMGYREGDQAGMWAQQALRVSTFDKLWDERTTSIGQGQGGARNPFSFPLGGGSMADRESFPLLVRATFMDSSLIEEGLREYGRLAKMNNEELAEYRARYETDHEVDSTLYIWVELQTGLAEDYLRLDRWTIFLEDDQNHQFDPVRVEPHPVQSASERRLAMTQNERDGFPGGRSQVPSVIRRDVELYFPKYQLSGEQILTRATKSLKFVMLQSDNPSVKAEGVWDFSTFEKK